MTHDPHAERRAPDAADPNWRHPVDQIEPEETGETFTLPEVCEAIWFMLAELKKSSCSPMALDCMCLAVGVNIYYREDGQVLADRFGVSRQRIHTLKESYQDKLGVIGGAFAKKMGARKTYSLTNHRPRKCHN